MAPRHAYSTTLSFSGPQSVEHQKDCLQSRCRPDVARSKRISVVVRLLSRWFANEHICALHRSDSTKSNSDRDSFLLSSRGFFLAARHSLSLSLAVFGPTSLA